MKIFPLPTFCSYVRKKKGKNNKTNLSLRVKWSVQTYNLQHTTTMHKWGQVQKREKSFYWHTSWQLQTKLHVFPSSFTPPLNSGCLWLPTTWVRPDSLTTHPNVGYLFLKVSFPSWVLLDWKYLKQSLLTNVLIYILSVCLSVWLPVCLWFRFWIRVVKSSPQFACIFCKTFSVLLTLDKTWWGPPTLFTGKSNNQC